MISFECQNLFSDLLHELEASHGLHSLSKTSTREVLVIYLYILSHNECIRATYEHFQHSSKTVNRYFSIKLDALVSLAKNIVKLIDPTFKSTPLDIYIIL